MRKLLINSFFCLSSLCLFSCKAVSCEATYNEINITMSNETRETVLKYPFNFYELGEKTWGPYKAYLETRKSGFEDMPAPEEAKTDFATSWKDIEHVSSFTPKSGSYDCVMIYIHGGAYISGGLAGHSTYCDNIAYQNNALVIAPNYELAPQACWKQGFDMLNKVYSKALEENKQISILGDSAGAGFALAFTLDLKERGVKLPKKIVASSPWLDVTMENPEIPEYQKNDRMLDSCGLIDAGKWWSGDLPNGNTENKISTKDYRISPIFGNYKGFPETLVFGCTWEIFFPDITKFVSILKDNNVSNTFVKLDGFVHAATLFKGFSEYKNLLNIVHDFINK